MQRLLERMERVLLALEVIFHLPIVEIVRVQRIARRIGGIVGCLQHLEWDQVSLVLRQPDSCKQSIRNKHIDNDGEQDPRHS